MSKWRIKLAGAEPWEHDNGKDDPRTPMPGQLRRGWEALDRGITILAFEAAYESQFEPAVESVEWVCDDGTTCPTKDCAPCKDITGKARTIMRARFQEMKDSLR